jgi:hypothetical protein
MLLVPVAREHWLPPPHCEVQLEPQEPEQVDLPSQVVVHPVPQLTEHVLFEAQSYVMLFGRWLAASPLPASPPAPPPVKLQVPPAAHVHTDPVQWQAPVH